MKILHLIGGEISGGAGRGAYWLHQAQREIGINSRCLTSGRENNNDPTVTALASTPFRRARNILWARVGNLAMHAYPQRRPWIFNTGFTGIDFTKCPEYRDADLIHLHWINGLVAMQTLRKVDKPIVWTMRDMWPFTGGCHVGAALNCSRYKLGCGQCPQLDSNRVWDLTRLVVARKQASLPRDMRIVGISQWLTECASESRVFDGFSVQTISNNIDTRFFHPISTNIARSALGLPLDKQIVLIGAGSAKDSHKGFDHFIQAMRRVQHPNSHVVTFGKGADTVLEAHNMSCQHLGYLSSNLLLRLAYSAADVFVAPSVVEAFGKTLAEAMACGTPAVCFDATGPRDIVEHHVTGYKAVPFETADLARGIEWVLDLAPEKYAQVQRAARERAVERFDSRVIAKKYKALYEEMIQGKALRDP